MALNIKSDEAHDLARALAEATDSSMTDVVTAALRRSLHEVRRTTDLGTGGGGLNREPGRLLGWTR